MEPNSPVTKTSIPGLLLIQRKTFPDERGFFRETVRISEMEQAIGFPFHVAQVNHARSARDTLRGIHAAPWNKLVYVVRGSVQAVIVDLRENSPAFGKHESFTIGEENRSSIFIPKGCGNSYLVLSEDADYTYLTDEEWVPDKEIGIAWNDPTLNIRWEIQVEPLISEKDKQNPDIKTRFPSKFTNS